MRLRPRRAAEYLGIGKSTLDKMRVAGTGPRYAKVGPRIVVYDVADLDQYLADRLQRSTSEELHRPQRSKPAAASAPPLAAT
jgi:predicted DNA-binding transcriptional regulator AlpA